MGFMKDYEKIYEKLTGCKLNWRGTFGFAYPKLGIGERYILDKCLGVDKEWRYRDPDGFVKALREKMTWLHDPTLRMLIEEGIGDFDELWEPEPEEEDELPGSFGKLMESILNRY
jgi:hypothetical protein